MSEIAKLTEQKYLARVQIKRLQLEGKLRSDKVALVDILEIDPNQPLDFSRVELPEYEYPE